VDEAGPGFAVADAEPTGVAADPFVASEQSAVSAADPFVADEEAVIAAESDPFTAATTHEAEAAAPVDAEPAPASIATNGVFADVAARLEDIARTLRERPDDLLSGSASDPLALLVAGYVMGYGARR
jgi:hypothetical protein